MLERMQTGRFKVFSHLNDWWEEMRMDHRKDGKLVKGADDLISTVRCALMMKRYAKGDQALRMDIFETAMYGVLDPVAGW